MIDSIVAALNKVYADWQGRLGAVGGAIIGMLLAMLEAARDQWDCFHDDYNELKKRVSDLEDSSTGGSTTIAAVVSAFQTAVRVPLGSANIAVQTAGLGSGSSATLVTTGGTGEVNNLGSFVLRMVAAGTPAAGAQVRVTPPTTLRGPVRVRLSPGFYSSGADIFDKDPYTVINYNSDGVTVSSIDISAAAALTASSSYELQAEVYQAPVA